MEQRFRKYVCETPTNTGCLLWNGYRQVMKEKVYERGYFNVNGKPITVSRIAYQLAKGDIPAGLCVRHTCDNSLCVNPNHLILGTHADNMRDMKERGRRRGKGGKQGENHPRHKLTAEQVREIRTLLLTKSHSDIASCYGITKQAITAISTGKTWSHII